jgi:hypothetical protein
VFALLLRDERRHVEYSKRLFAELAVGRATLVWVAVWEAARSARRSARAVLGTLHGLVMLVLYAAVLPFWLALRLRTRRARMREVAARSIALLER